MMSGNSVIVRRQAAFHSVLFMWVAASQKPMQSARVLPPPPGALGADSLGLLELGLAEGVPGDSARLLVVDPPVEIAVGSWGESGGIGSSSGRGAAIADGGMEAAGRLGGVGPLSITVVLDVVVGGDVGGLPGPVGRAETADGMLACAAGIAAWIRDMGRAAPGIGKEVCVAVPRGLVATACIVPPCPPPRA